MNCNLKEVKLFADMSNAFKAINDTYNNQFKSLLYFDENVELKDIGKCFIDLKSKIPSIEVSI